jgi:hypothetical protein
MSLLLVAATLYLFTPANYAIPLSLGSSPSVTSAPLKTTRKTKAQHKK